MSEEKKEKISVDESIKMNFNLLMVKKPNTKQNIERSIKRRINQQENSQDNQISDQQQETERTIFVPVGGKKQKFKKPEKTTMQG